MSQKTSGVEGMNDILPPDSRIWGRVESAAREVFDRGGEPKSVSLDALPAALRAW